MSDDISYNIGTDILLEWGQVFLQPEAFPEFLSDIEEEALSLGESLDTHLKQGTARIAAEAASARDILGASDIIGLTPDDEKWYEAEAAFSSLDLMIYMTEAMARMVRKENALLADTLLAELDEQMCLTADFLHGDAFSPLRLISFNEMRKNMLEGIGEDHRYLFPWYELLSEEDSGLLELLITHYHELNRAGELPELLRGNLPFYLAELGRDRELEKYLRTENAISLSLEKTFRRHWAFGLRNAARSAGHRRLLPEEVETLGIERISRGILAQKPQVPQDGLVLAVTGACFAPEIEEDRRIRLLLDMESRVKELPSDENATGCADQLKKLDQGEISAADAAELLLGFWFGQMETLRVSDEQKDMAELIGELLVQESGGDGDEEKTPPSAEDVLKMIIGAAICRQRIRWPLSFSMGETDDEERTVTLPGVIRVSGKQEADVICLDIASVSVPPEMEQISHEILTKLLERLNSGRETFYYQVLLNDPEGRWSTFPDKPEEIYDLKIPVPDIVPDEGFIFLSDTKGNELEKSAEAMMKSLNKTGKPGDESKVSSSTLIILVEI